MRFLNRAGAIFDCTVNSLAVMGGVVYVFLMLALGYGVVMRYFVGSPSLWLKEIAEYCLLYITLLSAPWLLRKEGHVKIDIAVEWLPSMAQKTIDIVTSLVCAALSLAIAFYGARVTYNHFRRGLYQPQSVLEIPYAYIMVIIPIAGFLLFIQFIRRTWVFYHGRRALRSSIGAS